MKLPRLIQGGMGIGVSNWVLAHEVSSLGQLGVVSGTVLDTILVRRLASGDPGGHMRRALAAFPAQSVVERLLKKYFREAPGSPFEILGSDGTEAIEPEHRFKLAPMLRRTMTADRAWLVIVANFVEVYLAKEGHGGVVGINFLHKIQLPTLPSLYGAMLGGVDAVLMGAGIPSEIPGVLDRLSQNLDVNVPLDVLNPGDDKIPLTFNPAEMWASEGIHTPPPVRRPNFLAIVSSATLARALLKKAPGGINGFIVEAPIAGGHNAPPRGPQQLSVRGEPIYGPRDEVDFSQMRELGVPFWLAGGYASREKFAEAISLGAEGIQVGTAFAFCQESGLEPELRKKFLAGLLRGEGDVFTDPVASPTSFPFKVAALSGSLADAAVYEARPRLCDLGYLRRAFSKDDGTVDYRCPAEPVEDYLRKGGKLEDTVGRKCLCNALLANIGLGQHRADGYIEPALLTAGNDLDCIKAYITADNLAYHARDVVKSLLPNH